MNANSLTITTRYLRLCCRLRLPGYDGLAGQALRQAKDKRDRQDK
ncbi:hypothetical protein D3OALGA1CA_190 [Olavius algarvensis associated proteobacterium Delta 3]|nr:hypothetical protein D3OALGA1CA_190 [Olavius algarvensis associated proteobacterium Delta 3]